MRSLQRERDLSQLAVGKLLGIAQQNAGRLLKTEAGFSYSSAERLAHALGYGTVDAFFAAKKVVSTSGAVARVLAKSA